MATEKQDKNVNAKPADLQGARSAAAPLKKDPQAATTAKAAPSEMNHGKDPAQRGQKV